MSVSTAKSLILKAQDNLEVAKKSLTDEKQHDVAGYNLAQACELFLKALLEMRGLEYPHDEEGRDLDNLMAMLEEEGFAEISSHADIIELTPYNDTRAHIRPDERLNLKEYLTHTEDLKKLVGDQLKLF
ncbi:MAG TPA: HEPN domain-containing protein [Bdellovibrio sp.]|nr:HEPN domain-containing protein [Bdellovibrio sp.]